MEPQIEPTVEQISKPIFPVTSELTSEHIADLVCAAYEYNYMSAVWLDGIQQITKHARYRKDAFYARHEFYEDPKFAFRCTVQLPEDEKKYVYVTVNRTRILKGLKLMANNHPIWFAAVLKGDIDAVCADLFLQLVIYGEVIFG